MNIRNISKYELNKLNRIRLVNYILGKIKIERYKTEEKNKEKQKCNRIGSV